MRMEYGICALQLSVSLTVWGSSVCLYVAPFRWRVFKQDDWGMFNVAFGPLGLTMQRRLSAQEAEDFAAAAGAAGSPATVEPPQ